MKFKKLTALALAAMMTVASLAACGEAQEQSNAESSEKQQESNAAGEQTSEQEEVSASNEIVFPLEEPMTFTMYNLMNDDTSLNDVDAWNYYEEMTNVYFENTEVTTAENEEKQKLLLASGEYPDVFWKSGVDADRYGMEGIFIPLEDLIREYAPNLTALLDEKDLWSEITAPDGHIYALPRLTVSNVMTYAYFRYNKAWLDRLGLDAPTNEEELYECLKAIKEQDANGNGDPDDEIPIMFNTGGGQMMYLMEYLCTDGVVRSDYTLSHNGNEVSYIPATEEFKEFLATCAKWYEEGLIDENSFIQTQPQVEAIGNSSDQYGFFFGSRNLIAGERRYDYHTLVPFEDMQGLGVDAGVRRNGMAITDTCENPEVLIAWADYFYTEEGTWLADQGIEGVNWEWDEEGYIKVLTPDEKNYWFSGTSFCPMYTPLEGYYDKLPAAKDPATRHNALDESMVTSEYGVRVPTLSFSEEAKERYSDLSTNIKPYVENYMAKVVTGEVSLEDTWEDFQAELEAMGVDEYLEVLVSAMPDNYVAAD